MTSRTFESIDHTRQLHVKPLDNHVTLVINYKDAGRSGLTISHSDAPALALAILEAAGMEAFGTGYLNKAVDCLQQHAREQERITAEAKEQAELEAEALALFNAYRWAMDSPPVAYWHQFPSDVKDYWLAVARKAREMRAGK